MAARVKPLTDTQIKQAKPDPEKSIKFPDGDGLQLLVKPNGSKIWHLRYTNPITKKKTTISLGSYPSLTLMGARAERKKARELLVQGVDPKRHREEERQKAIRRQLTWPVRDN